MSYMYHEDRVAREEESFKKMTPRFKYLPTYILSPHRDRKFDANVVEKIILTVLEKYLLNQSYDPNVCRELSKTVSDELKSRIKSLNLDRYKLVVLVHIGSVDGQWVEVASRCLMDCQTDNFASSFFKNDSLYAVATVYGMYHE